jgi:hypothetical protein
MSKLNQILQSQLTESNTDDSLPAQQRERNNRYYSLQPLGNEVEGYSHYIDPSVFESVEDKKAVYHETFLSTRTPVRFSGNSHEESAAKTAYTQRVLKANNYAELLQDFWHDSFVGKKGTVWADWRRKHEKVQLRFLGAPTHIVNQQLEQLGAIVGVDDSALEQRPIPSFGQPQFVYTGILTVTIDKSYIALDLIQPEYCYRDTGATYARDAMWNTRRIDKAKLQFIMDGFDPEQVETLKLDRQFYRSHEKQTRTGNNATPTNMMGRLGSQEDVTIYQTRTWLMPEDLADVKDYEPSGDESGGALYEIYWSGQDVMRWDDGTLAIRVLDDMDVFEWVEFRIAHSAEGMCTSDVEAHQQKAGSALKRGVMDNMHLTNNPRWEVNADGLRDLRDLYDNAIGGVIETDGGPVGNIAALQQPTLSPVVFGVLQMLDRDSEARSGMSDLASGMNMGAINNQNAENMVDKLATRGARRVAMGARDFANTWYIPIMQAIVRLARKYDKSQSALEADGKQIPITPAQWSDDDDMDVQVALTPEEAQAMSVRLLAIDARISQDETMKPLYGLKQKHALYDAVYELMGVKDATRFLASPESPEVKQALQQAQQQAQQMMAAQQAQAKFQQQALQDQLDLGWQALNNKIMDTLHDNTLDDKKFVMDTYFKRKELQLEAEQNRAVSI